MKFDMHFHTLEGSIDGKVGVMEALWALRSKGLDGVLITDHNSYDGFNAITEKIPGLTVLCGLEYDTSDGGHLLTILPDGKQSEILTKPGLIRTIDIIKMVRNAGGVCGLSHPYDCSRLGFMNRNHKDEEEILLHIDFIEGCNTSSFKCKNDKALKLAERLNKPYTTGSDSHRLKEIGTAITEISENITCNNDLIRIIRKGNYMSFGSNCGFRKPSILEPLLQFRVNLGGMCWLPWYKFVNTVNYKN